MILRNQGGKTRGIILKRAKLVARLRLAISRSNKIKTIDCIVESMKRRDKMTLAVSLEEPEQLSQESLSYRKDKHTLSSILNIMFQSGNNLQLMMSLATRYQLLCCNFYVAFQKGQASRKQVWEWFRKFCSGYANILEKFRQSGMHQEKCITEFCKGSNWKAAK